MVRSKNMKGAEKLTRQILQHQPSHPRAAYLLAHFASTLGVHEDRVDILMNSLQFHPANVILRRALVEAYEAIGDYAAGLSEALHLVEIEKSFLNHWILSRIFGHTGDHESALNSAEQAASYLETNSTELGKVDLLRGHALKILGRRSDSIAAYRACIKNTPGNGAGWWGLADFKTYHFSGEDKASMQKIIHHTDINTAQRCQATFALAKAYEMDGDMGKAFDIYNQANAMRPDIQYDPNANTARFHDIAKAMTPQNLHSTAKAHLRQPIPIFILGMPRAGSTLIEQILASHSKIEGTMELLTLPNLQRKIHIEGGRRFKKGFPQSLAHFSRAELTAFGQQYLDNTAMFHSDSPFFIDKLPTNFERIGLIHKILPQAIIIDARRHPLDCCFSAYKQHFANGHDYSYNLSHAGAYYNDYLSLMDHWDTALPSKVLCVQYENMVHNTEKTTKQILQHIGVSFEESCLKFYHNKRAVKTASSEQVRQPINTKGIGAWQTVKTGLAPLRTSLGPETLKRFEIYLPKNHH